MFYQKKVQLHSFWIEAPANFIRLWTKIHLHVRQIRLFFFSIWKNLESVLRFFFYYLLLLLLLTLYFDFSTNVLSSALIHASFYNNHNKRIKQTLWNLTWTERFLHIVSDTVKKRNLRNFIHLFSYKKKIKPILKSFVDNFINISEWGANFI